MPIVALLLLLLGSCTPQGPRGRSDLPVREVKEMLRLGSIDGEDAFAPITALTVSLDGGRVIVLENQTKLVKFFDSDGGLIRTAGGPGGGPGEFGNPMGLGVFRDTIWVGDVFTYRYSLFSPDGVLLGDFRPTVLARQRGGPAPARPSWIMDDGTLAGSVSSLSRDLALGVVTETPILLMDRSGEVLDTIGWRDVRNTAWMIRPDPPDRDFGEIHSRQPFGPTWPRVFSRLQDRVYGVIEVDSGETLLECTDFQGAVQFRVPVGWEGPEITQSHVDSLLDARLDFFGQTRSGSRVTRETLREWMEASLYVPKRLTAVERIELNSNGDIWLLLRTPSIEAPQRWRIFGSDSAPRFDVIVPAGFYLHEVREDVLWGVVHDDLDVPFIVKLKLVD